MALTVVAKGFPRLSGRGAPVFQGALLLSYRDASASFESSRRSLSNRARMIKVREETKHTSEKVAASSRKLLTPKLKDVAKRQKFAHFLVIDFEATCDHKSNPRFAPNEIIEFPVFKVNSSNFEIESVFHTFVRPTVNPQLKAFCTSLTGIVQDDLKDAPTFSEALLSFNAWMRDEGLLFPSQSEVEEGKDERGLSCAERLDSRLETSPPKRRFDKKGVNSLPLNVVPDDFAFVSYGDSDLGKMLPSQCALLGIPTPAYFRSWINLKISFSESHGKWARGITHMLDELKLPMHGRAHSGLDDCTNLVNIMEAIAHQKQFLYSITSTFKKDDNFGSDSISTKLKSFNS